MVEFSALESADGPLPGVGENLYRRFGRGKSRLLAPVN